MCGVRYASMPLFDAPMLEGAMNVDWKTLAKRTRDIAKVVNKAEQIEIKTPNGTYVLFSKKAEKQSLTRDCSRSQVRLGISGR